MKFVAIVVFFVGTLTYGQRSDFDAIAFDKADSIALKHKGVSLKNLPVLVHNLTSDLPTDVEKFRSIYTWVCTNIENDYGAYQKTVKKRKKLLGNSEALAEWNDNYAPKVLKKLVAQRKTACTGYAFLVREMANLADIKCKIINGYGRTPTLVLSEESIPNHSWNTVELNGKWYLCDPTWSAGRIYIDEKGARFEADYFDSYFLAAPELFIKNHYPLEINSSALEKPPTFNEFIESPVIYKSAFEKGIIPTSPSKMHLVIVKNKTITFTLTSEESLIEKSFLLELNSGSIAREVSPEISKNQNDFRLKYTFKKSGRYDVHIKTDDAIIATYVVKVRRR